MNGGFIWVLWVALWLPGPAASSLLPRLDALRSRTFLDPVVESMGFLLCSGHLHGHFPPNTHTLGPHNVESWSRTTVPILKGKKQILVIKCPIWGSLASWGHSGDTDLSVLAPALPPRSLCYWLSAVCSSLSHSAHPVSSCHQKRDKRTERKTPPSLPRSTYPRGPPKPPVFLL